MLQCQHNFWDRVIPFPCYNKNQKESEKVAYRYNKMANKTVNGVIEKAIKKGFGNVNGRMAYGWGQYGELESKYRATYEKGILSLEHWGTEILNLDVVGNTVISYYMESKSDRDAIVSALDLLGIKYTRVSYRPSLGLGEIV